MVTMQTNQKIVNFLDVTFNLEDGLYKPYRKPNETPLYVNTNSNHPPKIIKQLPNTINKRLQDLSSNKEVFDESVNFYNNALKESGHKSKFEYIENNRNRQKKNRRRNVIWFNPPYSVNVKSSIAHIFLNLLDKHFKKGLHKIFNRNCVKVSYSCMPNVLSHIKSHNANILSTPHEPPTQKKCNCRKNTCCPLQGNCMINSVVYRGHITNPNKNDTNYIGMTQNPFKDREREHRNSMVNPKKKKSSQLAAHIWNEKDNNQTPSTVTWSIIDRAPAYRNGDNHCRLCLTEKYHIIFQPRDIINKRCEIISKCRHENKFYLCNLK